MTEKYLEEKQKVNLKEERRANEELKANIEKLKISITDNEREIEKNHREITEEITKANLAAFDETFEAHTQLQQSVTELRVAKNKMNRQQSNPEEAIRDGATEAIQAIYQLSEALGLTVDKSANDAYSLVCSRVDSRRGLSRTRTTSNGRNGVSNKGNYGQQSDVKRNNFIVKRESSSRLNTSSTLVGSTKIAVKQVDANEDKLTEDKKLEDTGTPVSRKKVKIIDTAAGEVRTVVKDILPDKQETDVKLPEKPVDSDWSHDNPKVDEEKPKEEASLEVKKDVPPPKARETEPHPIHDKIESNEIVPKQELIVDKPGKTEPAIVQSPRVEVTKFADEPSKKEEPPKPKATNPLLQKENASIGNQ